MNIGISALCSLLVLLSQISTAQLPKDILKNQEAYYCTRNGEEFNAFYLKGVGIITALHCVYSNLNSGTNKVEIFIPSSDKKRIPIPFLLPIIKVFPQYDIAVIDPKDIELQIQSLECNAVNRDYLDLSNYDGYCFWKNKRISRKTELRKFAVNYFDCFSECSAKEDQLLVSNWYEKRKSGFENSPILKYDFNSFNGLSGSPIMIQLKGEKGRVCVGMHLGEAVTKDENKKYRFAIAFTKEVLHVIKSTFDSINYDEVDRIWKYDRKITQEMGTGTVIFQNDPMHNIEELTDFSAIGIIDQLLFDINLFFYNPELIMKKYDKYLDYLFWPNNVEDMNRRDEFLQARNAIKKMCPCNWSFIKLYCLENILKRKFNSGDFHNQYLSTLEECKVCLNEGLPKKYGTDPHNKNTNSVNPDCINQLTETNISVLLSHIADRENCENLIFKVRQNITSPKAMERMVDVLVNGANKFKANECQQAVIKLKDSIKTALCQIYCDSLEIIYLSDSSGIFKALQYLNLVKKYCGDQIYNDLRVRYKLSASNESSISLNTFETIRKVYEECRTDFEQNLMSFTRIPEYYIQSSFDTDNKLLNIEITYGESADTTFTFGNSYWNFRPGKYNYDVGNIMNKKIVEFIVAFSDSLKKNKILLNDSGFILDFIGMADGIPFKSPFVFSFEDLYPLKTTRNYEEIEASLKDKNDNYNLAFARAAYFARYICNELKYEKIKFSEVEIHPIITKKISEFGYYRKVIIKIEAKLK
ncbi:MAG: hypothetical protein ACO1G9_13530 [Bacteroidota bacterium]